MNSCTHPRLDRPEFVDQSKRKKYNFCIFECYLHPHLLLFLILGYKSQCWNLKNEYNIFGGCDECWFNESKSVTIFSLQCYESLLRVNHLKDGELTDFIISYFITLYCPPPVFCSLGISHRRSIHQR